jgi:hypothetical protein
MLAARSTRLRMTAPMTQRGSRWPLSIKRSRRAKTRTRTAASAKKDEQRCAEMETRSKNADERVWGMTPAPEGTSMRRVGETEVCVETGVA